MEKKREISKLELAKSLLSETIELQKKSESLELSKQKLKTEAQTAINAILKEYGLRLVTEFDEKKLELVHSKIKSSLLENNIKTLDIELDYKLEFAGDL